MTIAASRQAFLEKQMIRFWSYPVLPASIRELPGRMIAPLRYLAGLRTYQPTQNGTTSNNSQKLPEITDTSLEPPSVNHHEILTELWVLLEEYSPTWYREKERDSALAPRRLATDVLTELVALLEEYSPTWYTEKQRHPALAALRLPRAS